jgi:hypothetical protein
MVTPRARRSPFDAAVASTGGVWSPTDRRLRRRSNLRGERFDFVYRPEQVEARPVNDPEALEGSLPKGGMEP